jgi:undecaprenyl-diphosphatase
MTARMPEGWMLLVVFLIAGLLWIAAAIEDELAQGAGETDRAILMVFRSAADTADPIGPRWVEELARDITALGSSGALILLIAASVLFLFLAGQKRDAFVMMAATGGGIAATYILKIAFARSRPDIHDEYVSSFSFPSGHTVMAAVTYLTLGALFARELPQRKLKVYVMTLAVAVMILVGVSRIYLGVHWPSDVLAGWALGAVWALLCSGNAGRLRKGKRQDS